MVLDIIIIAAIMVAVYLPNVVIEPPFRALIRLFERHLGPPRGRLRLAGLWIAAAAATATAIRFDELPGAARSTLTVGGAFIVIVASFVSGRLSAAVESKHGARRMPVFARWSAIALGGFMWFSAAYLYVEDGATWFETFSMVLMGALLIFVGYRGSAGTFGSRL